MFIKFQDLCLVSARYFRFLVSKNLHKIFYPYKWCSVKLHLVLKQHAVVIEFCSRYEYFSYLYFYQQRHFSEWKQYFNSSLTLISSWKVKQSECDNIATQYNTTPAPGFSTSALYFLLVHSSRSVRMLNFHLMLWLFQFRERCYLMCVWDSLY